MKAKAKPTPAASTTAVATTGHQRRSATASTTNPPARASSDERENVKSSAAAQTAMSAAASGRRRPGVPGDAGEEQRDDERNAVASGLMKLETSRRNSPVIGVERQVVGQAAGAVVVEAELMAEVPDRAGAAPPLDVDGVEVDQPAHGERRTGAEQRPADPAQLHAVEDERAAEAVRDHGDEPVPKAVEDRLRARLPVEHVLRDERVEADDPGERQREPVDEPRAERQPARANRVDATRATATASSASFHACTASIAPPRSPAS